MYLLVIIFSILFISVIVNKLIWKEEITIGEMTVNLGVIVLMLLIFWGISYKSKVTDTEILNGKVISKERDRVSCSHSYPCNCYTSCSGSGKNRSCSRHCSTCYRHLFDYDWVVHSTIGNFYINRLDSQGLIEPPRYTKVQINDPVSDTHRYDNYIKGSNTSIFGSKHHYTKEELKQFPTYPKDIYDYYNLDRIIDLSKTLTEEQLKQYNKQLSIMLSETGFKKQANVVIIITNNSEEYAINLIDSWYGGKKNDIIVVIGLTTEKTIQYVKLHSWSLHTIFDIKLRDAIKEIGTLDLDKVIQEIDKELSSDYIRRSFKEFEYLKWRILPSTTSITVFTILTLITSTFIGYFMSKNQYNTKRYF